MKNIVLFILLLSISYHCQANDIAIEAVKSDKKVMLFLANKSIKDHKITFQTMQLGGICGFVGCNWRTLVSLVVTSKSANSPSTTILMLVEGLTSSINTPPTVTFVTLTQENSNDLVTIL
jgi:hypothetical protein